MSTVSVNQIEGQGGKIILDKDSRLDIATGLVLPQWENTAQGLTQAGFGSLGFNKENKDLEVITAASLESAASGGIPGSSIDNPASSPAEIIAAGVTTDGGYYIDLPSVGPKLTYCALNSGFQGGGWMLAWKCTRGSTFSYGSSYWTSQNTLNESDMSKNDADAKYDVFNYYNATQFMAIFPDLNNGGQASGYGNGWSWLVTGQNATCLNRFQSNQQLSGNPRGESMWSGSGFSAQGGFQWYGFNYTQNGSNAVRWGFGWNNEGDQNSNDITGGIAPTRAGTSAGDHIYCCQSTTGVNRSIRAEIWVK